MLQPINMDYMFYGCISLKFIDLSKINTIYLGSINFMFYDCQSLTNLNLNKF